MSTGSWTTVDKQHGFEERSLVNFKNNFFKNVTATKINKFRKIVFDRLPKLNPDYRKSLQSNTVTNIAKNSINVRTKIFKNQNRKLKTDKESLNQYRTFALLAISNRHNKR